MLSIVRRNFPLKAFAFALAVAAWAYFHFSANPSITARFDQQLSVPIVVTGLRAGYVARYTEKFAVVTIDATRNTTPVKPDQVEAVLNLAANADPGVFNVPVQIIAPNVQIRSLTPASVTLSIDRLEERTVPISIAYNGDFKNTVVDSAGLDPAQVTVRGIAADLARVQAVRVEITLPAKGTAIDAMIRPLAVTGAGDEVGAVAVSPNLVRVRARFSRSSATGAN
ncbi:MAG: hypothetical protein ABSB70_05065 [Candidatus Velthaea sp.]